MHHLRSLTLEQPDQAHEGGRVARPGLAGDQMDRHPGRLDLVGDRTATSERHDAGLDADRRERAARAQDQLLGPADAKVLAKQECLHAPTSEGSPRGLPAVGSGFARSIASISSPAIRSAA